MRLVKGFVTIQSLMSNTPGVISPIGEISPLALTFSRERGEYIHAELPGYRLIAMRSVDDVLGAVEVEEGVSNQIIEITNAVKAYANSNLRPYDLQDMVDVVTADFYSKISDLKVGPIVDVGSFGMPEWVSWVSSSNNDTVIKIWLSNAAFELQYDEFEIIVIPPVSRLDDLIENTTQARINIAERTLSRLMEIIEETKDGHPETYIRSYTFKCITPSFTTNDFDTSWNVLIYGSYGDNIDSIKDAMVTYVLANSAHTQNEWETILPDLFKRTEFVIIPRWDRYSVPNMAVQSGLYSSIIDPVEAIQFAKNEVNFYSNDHVNTHIEIIPYPYKAILLEIVGGTGNLEGKQAIADLFEDYIPVSSTSLDFNRMDELTQEWILMLSSMLIAAEAMTSISAVPKNMRSVYRNGKHYLASVYDGINYLMVPKYRLSA